MVTRQPSCDRAWEIDALRDGRLGAAEAASFERHRRSCEGCSKRFAEDARLVELGRSLDAPRPDEVQVRRMRGQLLRTAALGSAPGSVTRGRAAMLIAAACLSAMIMGAWLFVRPTAAHRVASAALAAPSSAALPPPLPAAEPLGASVEAAPGAVWTQKREHAIERVRLDDGAIVLVVRHQGAGERFLVDLPDGEIEVRGTRFEVVARGGRTTSVRVFEGLVSLRVAGEDERLLGAGESWLAPPSRVDAPRVAARGAGAKSAAKTGAPSAAESTRIYEDAMQRYRAGSYDDAARAFHAFTLAHPDAPEAEDAAFLEANALARAGRQDAAALVAERFVERYPSSFHARDAAILIARSARDRRDCEKARDALARWSAHGPAADLSLALGACDRARP